MIQGLVVFKVHINYQINIKKTSYLNPQVKSQASYINKK